MFKARTQEDAALMAPLKLTFGTKEYEVPILTVRKARAWRDAAFPVFLEIEAALNLPGPQVTDSTVHLACALTDGLRQFPEKLGELVFSYGSNLPQDEILDNATEEHLALAFSEIMQVAFPFLAQLGIVRQVLKAK